MLLLSPREKLVILKRCRHKGETLIPKLLDETTKAQLKKAAEWGNEECNGHGGWQTSVKRRQCAQCWQALLEEIK